MALIIIGLGYSLNNSTSDEYLIELLVADLGSGHIIVRLHHQSYFACPG